MAALNQIASFELFHFLLDVNTSLIGYFLKWKSLAIMIITMWFVSLSLSLSQ